MHLKAYAKVFWFLGDCLIKSWIVWIVGPVVVILILSFFLSAAASYVIPPHGDFDHQGVQRVERGASGQRPIREPEEDLLDRLERVRNREGLDPVTG